eukprot:gnl/MRDRNA2_/MRDRNA2_77871_c0_seq1.p1 gnl/MRDRNA2_/MRDRNA2_77871_c0~~gnl/MRDRNA2_/MRDRNA2_77871_c0_seq1.p1  ORF type:complete len:389 (+),score=51.13 gnl/MRDRNA2_/MRDRNA2_77871_c0_seq1:71-1237(+)
MCAVPLTLLLLISRQVSAKEFIGSQWLHYGSQLRDKLSQRINLLWNFSHVNSDRKPHHRMDLDDTILFKGATSKASLPPEIARVQELKRSLGVTDQVAGDGRYLLCQNPQLSSGKSSIYRAYRSDPNANFGPTGKKLAIKISPDIEALSRENGNYDRVSSGRFPGRFVNKIEFLEQLNENAFTAFEEQCALVLEAGRKDLKAILAEQGRQGLEEQPLRLAAAAAAQCIQSMHSCGLVWTDIKLQNFVLMGKEIGDSLPSIKGIDIESGMPHLSNPVDYSPEACPPEFARALLAETEAEFVLDYSYDIWSYGMLLYELVIGRSFFAGKQNDEIISAMASADFEADVSAVQDQKLRGLIQQCLSGDPKKRPNIAAILKHPYFTDESGGNQ